MAEAERGCRQWPLSRLLLRRQPYRCGTICGSESLGATHGEGAAKIGYRLLHAMQGRWQKF